jgi:hypothetical protein
LITNSHTNRRCQHFKATQEWWEELVGSAHPPPRFIIPAVGNTSQLLQIYISKRNENTK